MDEDYTSPPPGKYPHRFTQDDRFQYRVKVQPAGDCLEFTVRASDTRLAASADYRSFHGIGRAPRLHPPDDQEREDSIRRSVERSKRMVRLAALQIRADRLVTFTTRGVYDRPTLVVVWDRFLRLVRRVCPGFLYVAVPEPHKENPEHLHVHAAVHGWVNVKVLRRCWHAAILSVDAGARARCAASPSGVRGSGSPGNVDVSYKGRCKDLKSARRIAAYIGKYISKELVPIFNKKRYFLSKGVAIPEARRKWLESDNLDEALREVMREWGLLVDGEYPAVKVWKPGNLAFFWVGQDSLPAPPF